jgi:hypothetical protein
MRCEEPVARGVERVLLTACLISADDSSNRPSAWRYRLA